MSDGCSEYSINKISASIKSLLLVFVILSSELGISYAQQHQSAPAPLYRDPVMDGPADPVLIWNREEKSWWMLYTQRRANVDGADVAFCYGTKVGVASSQDHGKTWVYRGALDLEFENGQNTFWAPDVVYHNGTYHMYVSYIRGIRNHWGGAAHIVHYTSKNMWDWNYDGPLKLSSQHVIDATLLQMPDKKWRIWYKDESRGSVTMSAQSEDLENWDISNKPAIGGEPHEGPNIFRFRGYYWMLTDEWHGMRIYKSKDADQWTKQGLILSGPSKRRFDTPSGAHGDVVITGGNAYVFYFTHPGRTSHSKAPKNNMGNIPYKQRWSVIQVAKLELQNGTLVTKRDTDFNFWLKDKNE